MQFGLSHGEERGHSAPARYSSRQPHGRCCWAAREMDGSRGATGTVDVGVSHLNMNINVIGGLGNAVGGGASPSAGAGDSTASVASSSPPVRAVSVEAVLNPLLFRLVATRGFCPCVRHVPLVVSGGL